MDVTTTTRSAIPRSAVVKDRLSVIIPISERHDDLVTLHRAYAGALAPACEDIEFIYVLDGTDPQALAMLQVLRATGASIRILQMGMWFGEAAAINAGFAWATGASIMTLPAYNQVSPESVAALLHARGKHHMVVGYRNQRAGSRANLVFGRIFNGLVRFVTGTQFRDLGCGARLFGRGVLEEITIYGDQHRFLPVLAEMRGFSVGEVPLAQAPEDISHRRHGPGKLVRRVLDLVSVFFLARFTKKPLRFFGLIGSGIASLGALWMAVLVFERLFLEQPLSDRPALVLAALLVVLGVQIFALGLVGEIIIFTHAREIREYAVEEITS